jgi:PAS domain S-box-containing protein
LSQSSVTPQTAPPRLHFRVPPEPSHLLRARERLRDYLRLYCAERQVIDDVVLCIEEAATNAIRHSDSEQDIEISLRFADGDLVAGVQDHGHGFDVGSFDSEMQPDPLADHGRGLFIIAKLMDALELRVNGGLEVRMTRRAQPSCEPASLESGLDEPHTATRAGRREDRTRALLEEIDEGFVALDWEYRYVHVNEAMLRITQKSRGELLGHKPWELFPQLGGSPLEVHYRQAMELGRPSVLEHRAVVTGDWLEVRIYPTSVGVSAYYREISERKLAEAQAHEDQALLKAVMDGSPDPIFVKDRQSRMLLANAALLRVWGKPAEEVIGKSDRELYADPAIAEVVIENDRAVMNSGQSQALEETVQTQDGLRTYLSTKTPYRNAKGEVVGILGIARDISERKQADEELRQGEERFRSLFESTTEGIALHEVLYEDGRAVDYRIIDVNPSFESQTGVVAREARGRLASELYGTGEAPYLAEYARVAESGEPYSFETYFAPMGRHFHITVTSPGRGRFATVFEDITERKRAEETLRQSEERFRAFMSASSDVVYRMSPDWTEMRHLEGHEFIPDTDDPSSTWLERYIHPDDQPRVLSAIAESIRTKSVFDLDHRVLTVDGTLGWTHSRAIPLMDADGEILEWLGAASDITARKAAAEELRLHNADLAERAHFADSLNAINRLLHATLDFDTIMQGALDEGAEALAADAGMIEMREESQWGVRYQHGLAEADVGRRLSAAEAPVASRVEARGEPLTVADAQAEGVVDIGFLRAHSLRSLLAAPLAARATVIGCLVFYSTKVRVFSDAEIDFARKLGATVSLALENARLYGEQQHIAQTLQENFIHELPTVDGLELGVVSRTANEPELVGGDFSDVFVADDAHVVVLIGDVAGKGVRAAGLTETVRSTVRALAVTDSSPASILAKANDLLLRFDPDEPHVTAFLAVLDPHTGHLSYASAGHPAPVHLGAFTCRTLDLTFGPPLGTFERPYADAHVMLTLEDYLVIYTDGVTEARQGIELLGEKRLLEIVSVLRGRSAQEVAEGVRDAASGFADGHLNDDLQVVVLRLA